MVGNEVTTADWVRENGWKIGHTLINRCAGVYPSGVVFNQTRAFEITAIGERHVLAKQVIDNGNPVTFKERLESFGGSGWEKV